MGQLDTEQLVTDDNLTITSATSDQNQITVRCPIGNRRYSTLNLKKGPHNNNINITVCKDEDDYTRVFVEPDPNIERRSVKRKQRAKCLVALVSVVISILVCVAVFAAVQIILKAGPSGSSDYSKNNDSIHWTTTNSTNVGNVTALLL
ncbi:hypothetical protein ACJMK2_020919 [Sinanodonta woodiana]|uniref:Uncharacterized protein n=1 Tax=Sinanodonta woodiana TaxID=1069815 RepID=A0ABD3U3J4_SINWO